VEKVLYPGLPSHPQHEIAKKQQHGFGAMITFYCKGGLKEASVFLENVCLDVFVIFADVFVTSFHNNIAFFTHS
jgi:cystathionine beta-lyase/cystathionine gamma-synthase